jgi:phage baseplate assembly protein W
MIFAPLIPLQFDTEFGYQNVKDVKQLVKFHLMNLLLTNPGERITMPKYGIGIKRFLFENAATGVSSRIESRVRTQVATYLGYLGLQAVEVVDNQDYSLSLKIQYSVDSLDINDVLSLSVDLNSGDITTDTMGVNY